MAAMRQRWLLLVWLVALAASVAPVSASAARRAGSSSALRPAPFSSCSALVSYAQAHYAQTHGLPEQPLEGSAVATATSSTGSKANGFTAPSASASAASGSEGSSSSPTQVYSTTNDQEPGVDEPDIVKTNGSTIFTVSGDTLYAVTVSNGVPTLAGSLSLGDHATDAQLLLSGNTLLVVSTAFSFPPPLPGPVEGTTAARDAIVSSPYFLGGQTVLSDVDVSNPAAMVVSQTMTVEGSFVTARLNGTTARLVISSPPEGIFEPGLQAHPTGWVPSLTVRRGASGSELAARPVARCNDVYRPAVFSGLGMLTILTVNLADGLTSASAESLMADAQVVYGSQTSLYIASQRWVDPELPYDQLGSQSTVIDRFDVTDPDATAFLAVGSVPGYLLNQFSLSEYDGDLRVASTSRPIWWDGAFQSAPSQSLVTVLATVGEALVPVGQVSGLAEGGQISSVRFVGDAGYVSTIAQGAPFYTIDLSDPNQPTVSGELELSGDSSFLQSVGPGLLLGIGQVSEPSGVAPGGTVLDLFNVSDPTHPTLLAEHSLGAGSSSQLEYDPHALLFWSPTDLAVIPVQIFPSSVTYPQTGTEGFTGAIGFRLDSSGISELGQLVQNEVDGSTPTIERALVIDDQVYTVSDQGVMASSLDTLAEQRFVAFPSATVVPEPTPVPVPLPALPEG